MISRYHLRTLKAASGFQPRAISRKKPEKPARPGGLPERSLKIRKPVLGVLPSDHGDHAMTAIAAIPLKRSGGPFPVTFPAPSLLDPCYELAPPRGKAHGIKVLHAFASQKCEIFPAFFPDHGNFKQAT
jgi:hypothetical protein